MSNLLQSKKTFKYSVISVEIPRYIVHYTPHYFHAYALFLNAFLLLVTITHEISGLVVQFYESETAYAYQNDSSTEL